MPNFKLLLVNSAIDTRKALLGLAKVGRGGIGNFAFMSKVHPGLAPQMISEIKAGSKGLKALLQSRKGLAKLVASDLPKPSVATIDRIVNARGAGVRFIRKAGRIIPIRVWKK